jgi:hypothetical protein
MRLARAVLLGLLAAAATSAALAGPWQVHEVEGKNRAEVSNDAGTITLSIFCGGDGAMVSIVRQAAVPWVASQPADLTIDGETFSLTALSEGPTWAIFNLKPQTLKPAMVGALRRGDQLVLGGTALANVDEAERAFTLDGSSRALDGVPGGCT